MFIVSMNNRLQKNINFAFITVKKKKKKAEFMHAKVTTWTPTLVTINHETALVSVSYVTEYKK